jgi:hypothetical protein
MTFALHHTVTLAALVLHLASGVALEFAHHAGHEIGSGGSLSLCSHDCGDTERHLPVDAARFCAVCAHSIPLSVDAVSGEHALPVLFEATPRSRHGSPAALPPDVLSSGKRGPPAV